jgi:membrane protein DedA with SNARE-associated domain
VQNFNRQRAVLSALLFICVFAAIIFALRSYRSFLLLRSAYELGAPDVSSVRPWMTLDYIARTYRVPQAAMAERLQLPPDIDGKVTLRSLAQKSGLSRLQYIEQVQAAISSLRPHIVTSHANAAETAPDTSSGDVLTRLLVYGYPILALTVLLGAMGAPYPTALAVVVAGSLIAQEKMSWFWSASIAAAFSVVGDLIGYGLGRLLGGELLNRRARWLGFTSARRVRAELLLQQWGVITVLLSRSLLSFLSSAVNLLAGAGGYRLRSFVPFAIIGRLLWSLAYLSFGYAFGVAVEAAANFTSSLSGFFVALVAVAALAFMVRKNPAQQPAA